MAIERFSAASVKFEAAFVSSWVSVQFDYLCAAAAIVGDCTRSAMANAFKGSIAMDTIILSSRQPLGRRGFAPHRVDSHHFPGKCPRVVAIADLS
jgi:hypothetical protein